MIDEPVAVVPSWSVKIKERVARVCGECLLNRLIVARGICHDCVKREEHRQELYRLNHPAARILPFRRQGDRLSES